MKKTLVFTVLASLALAIYSFTAPADPETIAIGTKAPRAEQKMKDISGKEFSLNDVKKEGGLLVIFSCNTCPFVVGSEDGTEGWEGRYAGIKKSADSKNIGLVLVNSNEAKRTKGDNLDDMKKRAKDQGFADCTYVLDENSQLADAFGARTTPHVFLFNKNMELVYRGAIDDNVDDAKAVKDPYLAKAMENLVAGKKVDPAETRPVGCSIKRVVTQ